MHKNEKLLVLGIIISLLVGVIGYSFAYFTSSVIVDGSGSNHNMTTADLIKVEYDAGTSVLTLENALPGANTSKKFSVNITPTKDQKSVKYAITLNITENSFTKCSTKTEENDCVVNANEVVVSLKRAIDGGMEEVLTSNRDITLSNGLTTLYIEDLTFTDVNTHVYAYTLDVSFINTGAEQNHNMNKNLAGTVIVSFAE